MWIKASAPTRYAERKVPTTLIARNLMLAHHWGLKTFYYSLIDKQGSKVVEESESSKTSYVVEEPMLDDDCEACKL